MRDKVLARLRAGDKLHMQLVDGRREWWFEQPRQDVPDKLVQALRSSGEAPIVEAGDSLFGLPDNSQTWGVGIRPDRTPCLNPRCRRTFKQDHEGETVVCRKCWMLLPASWRARDKQMRRRMRMIDRMAAKGTQHRRRGRKHGQPECGVPQAYTMGARLGRLWDRHWDRIRAFYLSPEKPEGLDVFLDEVGL